MLSLQLLDLGLCTTPHFRPCLWGDEGRSQDCDEAFYVLIGEIAVAKGEFGKHEIAQDKSRCIATPGASPIASSAA